MNTLTFKKAERSQVFLKLAITGPTGSGKTYSALRMAFGLIDGTDKRVAFLDTENDSASLYSDKFDFDVIPVPPPFEAEYFSSGISAAVGAGYGVVIIDSASHLWKGILAYKDQIDSHGKGNSYTNWKQADAKFEPVIEAVLHSKIHVIFCMRSKMDYAQTEESGKKVVKKMGLAPIMRDGLEYEFSTVLDVGLDHTAQSSKDRTGLFPTDKIFQITEETGKSIAAWLKTAKPKQEQLSPSAVLTEDDEKQKRIKGRSKAIHESCPQSIHPNTWNSQYLTELSLLLKIDPIKSTLMDFTLAELRAATPEHDTIVKTLLEQIQP